LNGLHFVFVAVNVAALATLLVCLKKIIAVVAVNVFVVVVVFFGGADIAVGAVGALLLFVAPCSVFFLVLLLHEPSDLFCEGFQHFLVRKAHEGHWHHYSIVKGKRYLVLLRTTTFGGRGVAVGGGAVGGSRRVGTTCIRGVGVVCVSGIVGGAVAVCGALGLVFLFCNLSIDELVQLLHYHPFIEEALPNHAQPVLLPVQTTLLRTSQVHQCHPYRHQKQQQFCPPLHIAL